MSRLIELVDSGDFNAPPGSIEHTLAIKTRLQFLIDSTNTTEKSIKPYMGLLQKYEGWKNLLDESGNLFETLEQFIDAPFPFGLNHDKRVVGLLRKHGANQWNGGDNNHVLPQRGTTGKPYILARLARDRPDILEDFYAGKHRSARQAGIAAGFVKDRKYIQVAPDPERIAKKLKEVLTQEQVLDLIDLLKQENNESITNSQ